MAKILKFTPKAHLDTETLARMAAVAAERFRSLPSAIRKGQEPPSQMVCGVIKGAQAADVARWLYQNLTLPKKQFAEFRKVVTDAGIANNITGGTALDALIERTVATQKPTLEAIAERFGATLVEGEVSGAEDVADELEARERAIEDARREAEDVDIGLLREWMDDFGWLSLMILADERGRALFKDQYDFSRWAQENWHGSTAFRAAPLGVLDWQGANDAIFHWMEECEFDLEHLNRIVANAMARR